MIRFRVAMGALAVLSLTAAGAGAQTVSLADFEPLVASLTAAARTSDVGAYLDLLADDADRFGARAFAADALRQDVRDAAARARFVRPLDDDSDDDGYELTVEVFTERGVAGRLQTWSIDVVPDAAAADRPGAWRIADQERVDVVDGLLNLSLNPDVAYDAAGFVIAGEDMTLSMSRGTVFVAETGQGGITGMVLLGRGILAFSPAPEAERGQVRLLTGRETLETVISAAFVRVNPVAFASRVSTPDLNRRPVDGDDLARAREIFDRYAPLSFGIDLGDLSEKAWSLTPGGGDFIADMQTERYGTLTFAQSANQPEDVSLYERESQRIIALYPSAEKRAARGRYYSDDDSVAYDVLDYQIAASFEPAGVERESLRARPRLRGCFINGRARLAVRVTGSNLTSLTLRLARRPRRAFRRFERAGSAALLSHAGTRQPGREPAEPSPARRRGVHPRDRVLRAARSAGARGELAGPKGFRARRRGRRHAVRRRGAPLHLQQRDALVPAREHFRLRDRDAGPDRTGRLRRGRQRRTGRGELLPGVAGR